MGPGWSAANGAIFHLGSDNLRPFGWTSADAAGLPILLQGSFASTRCWGARSATPSALRWAPQRRRTFRRRRTRRNERRICHPLGLRLRLRADYPVDGAAPAVPGGAPGNADVRVDPFADNGSDWYISGDSDDRWDPMMDALVSGLRAVHGSDFEILDTGSSMAE